MKRRTNQIKKSTFDKWFDAINMILMLALAAIMLYPMLYVLFASLSDPIEFMKHKGFLWHSQGFTFKSYISAFENPMLLKSYANTIFILVVGVLLNLVLTGLRRVFFIPQGCQTAKSHCHLYYHHHVFQRRHDPLLFCCAGAGTGGQPVVSDPSRRG